MEKQVRWRTVGIAIGATVVVAFGGAWAANATGVFERPAPEPTAVIQEQPTPTPTVTMTPTPTPTAEPVVETPPAEDPVYEDPEPAYGSYPAGWPVPWIPSSDPNNASGGEWDTTACASGRAYWEGDASYCG